jgi:hypothetical protein
MAGAGMTAMDIMEMNTVAMNIVAAAMVASEGDVKTMMVRNHMCFMSSLCIERFI